MAACVRAAASEAQASVPASTGPAIPDVDAPTVDTFTLSTGRIVQVPRGVLVHTDNQVHRMPVDLIAGLVFIHATVDGQTGLFIVDTGNPTLLLNTHHLSGGPTIDSAIVTDAVGRNVPVLVHAVRQFQWNGVSIVNLGALGMDLSSVESQLQKELRGQPILGMVGVSQLSHFISVFDYGKQAIELYPSHVFDRRTPARLQTPDVTVPLLTSESGLFVEGVAGDKSFLLRIDSGDDGLGIDEDFAATLGTHVISAGRMEPTMGVGGVIVTTPIVVLDRLMIGAMAYDSLVMRSHLLPANPKDPGRHPQGNLGAPFFRHHRIGLDLRRKRLYLWRDSTA